MAWHITTNAIYGAVVNMFAWWLYKMETFSALLALCAGNWPVTGEFPTQRPVTRSFFYLRRKQRLGKQLRRRWLETPPRSLWRHCNGIKVQMILALINVAWIYDTWNGRCVNFSQCNGGGINTVWFSAMSTFLIHPYPFSDYGAVGVPFYGVGKE